MNETSADSSPETETPPKLADSTEVGSDATFESVTRFFHRVNRVLPEQQILLSFSPDITAREALARLRIHGYSQAPVLAGETVIGVFSYRSYASRAANFTIDELQKLRASPGDLQVEEYLERMEFARVTDEIEDVFRAIDRDNGILVGSPERLQGVLTPMDFLRYLYGLASPFVLLSEIELSLRALIKKAVDDAGLADCARRSLKSLFDDEARIPLTLEAMSFDNYRMVITNGQNWPLFTRFFGANRDLASGKLQQVGELRNDVFHFKRHLAADDIDILKSHRDWLMTKAQRADAEVGSRGGVL